MDISNSGIPEIRIEFNMDKTDKEMDPEEAFADFDFAQPPLAEI